MARILYVSYDGLMEPLGQSQVLQYVRGLASEHAVSILSYEKASDLADSRRYELLHEELRFAGISWHPLTYHKRPTVPATAFDIFCGLFVGLSICVRERVEIVHARSYVPALIAWALKRILGPRFIFDMRGFWPDQRVDDGFWRTESASYRLSKWFERRFLNEADAIVSLTHAAVDIIRDLPYLKDRSLNIVVIPTCTNLSLFRRPDTSPAKEGFCLGFVGSVRLYLFDEVLAFFGALRNERPSAKLRIVSRDEPKELLARAVRAGIPAEAVSIRSVEFDKVPGEMGVMDASVFFLAPSLSRQAISPTKLGELLACGVPCVTNAGVGDFERIITSSRTGVIVGGFTGDERAAAVGRLLALVADPAASARCAEAALKHFSLEAGIAAYSRLYRSLGAA